MPLLIDTYNVLHTVGILPPELAGIDLPGLIHLIQNSRYRDERLTLVCDGKPHLTVGEKPIERIGQITVRYSGPGKLADDLIGQLIRASTAPRLLFVVSSDHEITRTARRRRCKTLTSEEFLEQLAADSPTQHDKSPAQKKPPGGMSDKQVQGWVNIFNLDEKTIAIPTGGSRRKLQSPEETESVSATDSNAGNAPTSGSPNPPSAPPEHTIKQLPPREGLPESIIEQAERLWMKEQSPKPPK